MVRPLFRMRAEDFGVIQHKGGISPAWPITYTDMEPYYTRAEELFHVHGDLGTGAKCSWRLWQLFRSYRTVSLEAVPLSGFYKRVPDADD